MHVGPFAVGVPDAAANPSLPLTLVLTLNLWPYPCSRQLLTSAINRWTMRSIVRLQLLTVGSNPGGVGVGCNPGRVVTLGSVPNPPPSVPAVCPGTSAFLDAPTEVSLGGDLPKVEATLGKVTRLHGVSKMRVASA